MDREQRAETTLPALRDRALSGGFTYRVDDGPVPSDGYVVSCHADREHVVDVDDFSTLVLVEYVRRNRDRLTQRGHYFGAWRDGDRIVLDVVEIVDELDTALRLAVAHGQDAVWDIANAEEIRA